MNFELRQRRNPRRWNLPSLFSLTTAVARLSAFGYDSNQGAKDRGKYLYPHAGIGDPHPNRARGCRSLADHGKQHAARSNLVRTTNSVARRWGKGLANGGHRPVTGLKHAQCFARNQQLPSVSHVATAQDTRAHMSHWLTGPTYQHHIARVTIGSRGSNREVNGPTRGE